MFFIPVFLPSAKGSGAGSKTVVQSLIYFIHHIV